MFAFLMMLAIVFVFFPHQQVLHRVFQEILGKEMDASFVNVRKGLGKASAASIVVGHRELQGQPLFELKNVSLFWNPLSIFKGSGDIYVRGEAYGGIFKLALKGFPLFAHEKADLTMVFEGIDLGKYPTDRLPWFKGLEGRLNGTLTADAFLLAREQRKGSFALTVSNGAIKNVLVKNVQGLNVHFDNLTVHGKSYGDTVTLDKVTIHGQELSINGTGRIERGLESGVLSLRLPYESLSENSPLPGKGILTISGPVWSPAIDIFHGTETQQKQEPSTAEK